MLRLVDLVSRETGVDVSRIVLLRHSTARIEKMEAHGLSVKEHTPLKSKGGEYDYDKHGDEVVVVIARDRVEGVYRVLGIEAEGTFRTLGSGSRVSLEKDLGKLDKPARRFRLQLLRCSAENRLVTGWTAPIQATLRFQEDRSRLFWKIEVDAPEQRLLDVETAELSDRELEDAIKAGLLRIGMVATATAEALVQQRRGADVLRRLTIFNYQGQCAVCDIAETNLLEASHIATWAESPESRGMLANVICLCSFHHALLDNGYWSLDDHLRPVLKRGVQSETIRNLLPPRMVFRKPLAHPPFAEFVRQHRVKHGFDS
jgi:hypothetical protein